MVGPVEFSCASQVRYREASADSSETIRCCVEAGLSLRSRRAMVAPGAKQRVRKSFAIWLMDTSSLGGTKNAILRGVSGERSPVFAGPLSEGGGAYAASSSVASSSSSADALAARSSLRIEFTRISQMVCSEFVFLLSYLRLRSSPSTWI